MFKKIVRLAEMDCIGFDIASFSCYDFGSWCKNTGGGIATNCFFAKSYCLFTVYCSTKNHFNCIFYFILCHHSRKRLSHLREMHTLGR